MVSDRNKLSRMVVTLCQAGPGHGAQVGQFIHEEDLRRLCTTMHTRLGTLTVGHSGLWVCRSSRESWPFSMLGESRPSSAGGDLLQGACRQRSRALGNTIAMSNLTRIHATDEDVTFRAAYMFSRRPSRCSGAD